MGRILSIDLGKKRTGMAWTDPLQLSINPLPTLPTDQFEEDIIRRINGGEVTDVVFGLPAHADGTITEVGHLVQKYIAQLNKTHPDVTYHTIDESYTSQRAREMMVHLGTKKKKRRQKESVDQMSAVIILKDFMDRL